MIPLPIDPHIPEIIAALHTARTVILTAPPGAGKTTRVPRALFDAGFANSGEILILEPRRLAARMAAARVAEEFGEKPGKTVGYSIRFENVSGPSTRIRFLTEAILARRMVQDPNLDGVSTVILDEFHERHLVTDLALAFLKRLQERRRTLRLVLMSATMDTSQLCTYLVDSRVLSVADSPFDRQIEHEARCDGRPLHEKVASAVSRLLRSRLQGDILVFLPGAAEIRRAAEILRPASERLNFSLHLLHGDMPVSEQQRSLRPSERTKVILSTNVAETSVTIPGIAAVIDSGLAVIAGHSPWSGLPTLSTDRISKSSAIQRAGRAGRTQSGLVLRLYTKQDFLSRQEHVAPEIKRADLAETALLLHGAGIRDLRSFSWFEPPAAIAVDAAETLLLRLGAITEEGKLSDLGKQMLRLPLHPRLARLVLEGHKLGLSESSTLLAALLSERDIRLDVRTRLTRPTGPAQRHGSGPSDLLELLDRYREAETARFESARLADLGLDAAALRAVRRSRRQLLGITSGSTGLPSIHASADEADEALLISVLSAFPDRVAKRRRPGSRELLLAAGGSAILSPSSIVHDPMFVVAVDAEDRREKPTSTPSVPKIRLASGIEVEWLAGLFPESISQKIRLLWNERASRVDEIKQTSYDQIALEETVCAAAPSESASELLASAVLNQASLPFRDASALSAFRSRLLLLSGLFPQENMPAIGEAEIGAAVRTMCAGKRSFAELEPLSIVKALMQGLTDRQRALLLEETPERIRLKSGRCVNVHYENAQIPWIESRLQDFFGIYSSPVICGGRIALTVHLLAPNGRAVQVTGDLAGFWKNHYPAIRRELKRRYPKHAWPDPDSLKEPC